MNSREKIEELYRLYEKPMYYIALAVLGDHHQAEDAVSDAFYKMASHLDKLSAPQSASTKSYIIKTIRSVAISRYRKNATERKHFVEFDENICCDDPFDKLFDEEKSAQLNSMLASLSETDAEIVVMRGRDRISYRDIASYLKISESAARKRFERARKAIIANCKER